jgi:nitroreductase
MKPTLGVLPGTASHFFTGSLIMGKLPHPLEHRKADHQIQELFLRRWSPRALTGEAISHSTLLELFEAARWAPSTYNEQEWRFLYAHRDTPEWPLLFDILAEANQLWCVNAAVLILALSKKTFARNGKPNPVHSVDTGMAVENLMLEAASRDDLVAHGMAGFDRAKARITLGIPDDYEVECMIAVGRPGDPDLLPPELKARETVSDRKKVEEFIRPGKFAF